MVVGGNNNIFIFNKARLGQGIIILCEKYGNGIKYYLPEGFCNPCFPVLLGLIAMQEYFIAYTHKQKRYPTLTKCFVYGIFLSRDHLVMYYF